jgi:hypothetical protein
MLLKLITIKTSHKKDKKLDAVFEKDGKEKVISFGASGYTDFTKPPHDEERKERYIKRHQKRENFNDPLSKGALSRYVLWSKPSLEGGIKEYKKRFNL